MTGTGRDASRLLFDELTEGFAVHEMIYGPDGAAVDYRFLDVNPAFERITGLPRADVVGRTVKELLPELEPVWIETYARVVRTGEPARFEQRARALGRTFDVRAYRPRPGQFATLFLDVSAARRRATHLTAVLDATQAQLALLDRDFRFLMVNQAYEAGSGHTAAELIGRDHFELFPNDENRASFERVRASGEPWLVEARPFEYADDPARGVTYWNLKLAPVKDEDGRVEALLLSLLEVTEQVRSRQAAEETARRLAAAHERLAVTLGSIGDAVIAVDPTGRVELLNRVAERLTGWPQAEAAGRPLGEVFVSVDEATGAPAPDPVRRALEPGGADGGLALHAGLVSRDGRRLSIASSAAPIRTGRGEVLGVVLAFRDVTEDRAAGDLLREADRRKDEWIAMLSHELRSPLSALRSSLYVLGRAEPGGEQAARAQEVMDRQVTHLSRLVDDLLDVTRISRGKITILHDLVDLGELVRRTVEDQRAAFVAKGIQLDAAVTTTSVWVEGDATRLAQVLGNLLNNACKFTAKGGAVEVTLLEGSGLATLRVRDSGFGIAPELVDRIFEPFTQGPQALDRSLGGLGLGLPLVKGFAELHGGTVRVTSGGPGRGATFTVTLPLSRRRPHPASASPGPSPQGVRILVIEDNLDAAESLREALELLGDHEVAVAHTGPDGIALARRFAPRVVLCDVGLPGLDGYGVARAFRADPTLAACFLVALTGYALPEDIARARASGFDRHLAKPPSIDKIEGLLAQAVAARAPGTAGAGAP